MVKWRMEKTLSLSLWKTHKHADKVPRNNVMFSHMSHCPLLSNRGNACFTHFWTDIYTSIHLKTLKGKRNGTQTRTLNIFFVCFQHLHLEFTFLINDLSVHLFMYFLFKPKHLRGWTILTVQWSNQSPKNRIKPCPTFFPFQKPLHKSQFGR